MLNKKYSTSLNIFLTHHVKYMKIFIPRDKLKFTKLFNFVSTTNCTYKYIYMTSFHSYMFRLLTAIIMKPHQHSKLNAL